MKSHPQMTAFAALILLSMSTLACGFSPILNHLDPVAEGPQAPRRDLPAPSNSNCPLELGKSAFCASVTWDSAPNSENDISATLRFWDLESGNAGGPYHDPDGEVAVQLWMPSMGHGSLKVIVAPQGNGIYKASRVFFSMPGEWEVRVQIKRGGQLFDQASFAITL